VHVVLTSAVVQMLEAGLDTEDDAVRVAVLLKSERQLPGLYAAMGCLIPRALGPRRDGEKPTARPQTEASAAGVVLNAGKLERGGALSRVRKSFWNFE
jgi:hypothetical protein